VSPAETYLLSHFWLPLAIWLPLYLGDYYLTIWGAKLYQAGANEYFVFGGSYELTPIFQRDIDTLRNISPRFLGHVLLSVLIIMFLWFIAQKSEEMKVLFTICFGGYIFQELAIWARHVRNIVMFSRLCNRTGATGRICYEKWFTLENSCAELIGMAAIMLAASLIAWNLSLLGGAIFTTILGIKHRKLARRSRAQSEAEENSSETSPEE
jgi:hypothetical protein